MMKLERLKWGGMFGQVTKRHRTGPWRSFHFFKRSLRTVVEEEGWGIDAYIFYQLSLAFSTGGQSHIRFTGINTARGRSQAAKSPKCPVALRPLSFFLWGMCIQVCRGNWPSQNEGRKTTKRVSRHSGANLTLDTSHRVCPERQVGTLYGFVRRHASLPGPCHTLLYVYRVITSYKQIASRGW